jgi:nucleotide-binding universal stress UspA family protein
MAFNKVLVAYDGSDYARSALEVAKEMAQLNSAVRIDISYVVPIPLLTGMGSDNIQEIIDMMMEDGKQLLIEARDVFQDVEDQITTLLLKGTSPASELIKLIELKKYDLIIIGSRGLSGIRERFGSVSYKILHNAEIPVLVI